MIQRREVCGREKEGWLISGVGAKFGMPLGSISALWCRCEHSRAHDGTKLVFAKCSTTSDLVGHALDPKPHGMQRL